jgi:hypothetical protein
LEQEPLSMNYATAKDVYRCSTNNLNKVEQYIGGFISLINAEISKNTDLSLLKRIKAYRHGFLSEPYYLFDLDSKNTSEYLTDWQRRMYTPNINGDYAFTQNDKLLSYHILSPQFDQYLPELYAVIREGEVAAPPTNHKECTNLLDCVDSVGSVVIKPFRGSRGKNVMILKSTDEGYTVNSESRSPEELVKLLESLDGYLVTEMFEQTTYANNIYASGANTMRIMTMTDPRTKEPYIGAAVHRFATDASAPVDNYSDRGGVANIDIETGELGRFAIRPVGDAAEFYSHHPDTGAPVSGVTIPSWDVVTDTVLELATSVKELTPYLGWDVMVTDTNGETGIVEANALPDIHAVQTHQPLLANERNRLFYKYYNII